jgi:formate hydrogenlyase transcriptional activator
MSHSPQLQPDLAFVKRYEAVLEVFRSLAPTPDPGGVLRLLPGKLRPLLNFDYLSIYLSAAADAEGIWYVAGVEDPLVLATAREVPFDEALSSWVIKRQQPVSIPYPEDTAFRLVTERLIGRGLQSACAVPLTTARGSLGSVTFASKRRGAYSDDEMRLLKFAADQVGIVIVLAESQKRSERAELILNINNSIASNLEMHALLCSAAASLRRTLRCDIASVATPDAEMNNLLSYAMDFPDSRGFLREGNVIPIEGSVLGQVFKTRRLVELAAPNIPVDPATAMGVAEGLQFACIYPLINRERTLGVLTVGRRGDDDAFSRDEIGLLCQVAHQLAIALDNAMAYREISELKDQLAQEKLYLEDEIRGDLNFEEIVGQSPSLRKVLKEVETVAPTDSNVLIYGETGSGKELFARAIHDFSSRRSNTFVKLNCAAIPTGLLESELFGHEKGAFTGAVSQRIGRFELAHRGTVFLDEIGEVPLELQPKLLRVLQEREFERLGSSRTLRSDARLIAATNRDLGAMVQAQTFRSDLFYRLNVFPIHVPPLRDRPGDIPLLIRRFVQQFARRMNKSIESIPTESMHALTHYQWPGNIRELQNLIERAMILSNGPVLRVPLGDLKTPQAPVAEGGKNQTLEDAERAHILAILKETKWVLSGPQGAAARLGLNRSTLRFRMGKLGIVRPAG